jgi:hypothetical protein
LDQQADRRSFGVREDTVRLWRSDFMRGGVGALKASVAQGPAPVKAAAALKIAAPLSSLGRGQNKLERKKRGFCWRRPRHMLKGRQDPDAIDRVGLRLKLRKVRADAGHIVLLICDESEALTHPYLAGAWAKRGANLCVPAPGQS